MASAVAVGLMLFVGWTVYDAVFGRGGAFWGASATSKQAKPFRDARHPQPVYIPLAYVPRASASADAVVAGLQRADDQTRTVWEAIEQARQRRELRYVMSMAADPRGHIWAGCEDAGVWRYDPSKEGQDAWKQFTAEDGLGDDSVYAVAVDHQGRVWVGHLNHGVSVYDGLKWQNYDVVGGLALPTSLSGPLGERVFDIAVCPIDGDVWIASNGGLARYSVSKDSWSYYTRAEGLPSDQASAIAFDASGTIYVGTQCDGIAVANTRDNYKAWRAIRGPDRVPTEPAGQGLPTNLINDVLVAKSGIVYAATTTGLAFSKDRGQSWQFVRGKDWAAKVRGLHQGPPEGWTERPGAWLAEDYVTCLAEDDKGLWVGYREEGYQLVEPQAGRTSRQGAGRQFVTAILPTTAGLAVGTYGDGQVWPRRTKVVSSPQAERAGAVATKGPVASLPTGAKPPSAEDLAGMLARLKAARSAASANGPIAIVLGEDWRTRGDWLGRYGRYWACTAGTLAGLASPGNYLWGAAPPGAVDYYASIGPHSDADDRIRHWIHRLYTTDPRSLELPPVYLHSRVLGGYTDWKLNRRQSEWDDHGEAYPRNHDGPDIYCNLSIPSGVFCLSLYDTNKDGHNGNERYRDYVVSLRTGSEPGDLRSLDGFEQQAELARARIQNFWHGCYKRFLVRGPAKVTIRVQRNYSFNTILAGVMLDSVQQLPEPYAAGPVPVPAPASTQAEQLADGVDQLLRTGFSRDWGLQAADAKLLRWYVAQHSPDTLPVALRIMGSMYRLRYFEPWERLQSKMGLTTAREIEKSLRWDRSMPNCSGQEAIILAKKLSMLGK